MSEPRGGGPIAAVLGAVAVVVELRHLHCAFEANPDERACELGVPITVRILETSTIALLVGALTPATSVGGSIAVRVDSADGLSPVLAPLEHLAARRRSVAVGVDGLPRSAPKIVEGAPRAVRVRSTVAIDIAAGAGDRARWRAGGGGFVVPIAVDEAAAGDQNDTGDRESERACATPGSRGTEHEVAGAHSKRCAAAVTRGFAEGREHALRGLRRGVRETEREPTRSEPGRRPQGGRWSGRGAASCARRPPGPARHDVRANDT